MVVVAIVGLLAAIGIPNFVHARMNGQKNACINNLRQIDGAKQEWALDAKAGPADSVTLDIIKPYLGRGTAGNLPHCPADPTFSPNDYVVGDLQTPPTCSIVPSHVLD